MDILRLLDELHELAVDRPRTILGLTFGLDKDEISMQIHKIKASLPNELKAAVQTVRESDRIVDNAREDATTTLENARKEAERIVADAKKEGDRLIEQARLEQERMIQDSEILKLSKAQSEEIRTSADREALHMRRGAENYAHDVLSQLEGVVGKVLTTIERGKQEITPREVNAVVRERVKVQNGVN